MNCTQIQQLLSAYYDGELADDAQSHVSEHLSQCAPCAEKLAGFRELSKLTGSLQTPPPPAATWAQLEAQLDDATFPIPVARTRWLSIRNFRILALAATIMIAIGLGWFAYDTGFGHGDHSGFAAEFGHYLEEFNRDPSGAQQMIVAKYDGKAVEATEAVQLVGYQPATLRRLHKDYQVKSTHVLKMPCCTCVQTVCERSDGSTVAIFEHDDENPEWFGDQPGTIANCSGQRCRLFDLSDRIAASWQSGPRHITVIGVRNADEVNDLVDWLRVEG